jgi:hypothetical protein
VASSQWPQGQGLAFGAPFRVLSQFRSISHCATSALTGIQAAFASKHSEKKAAVEGTAAQSQ